MRNLFIGTVAVPLLIATVYECDVLPTGVFAGKAQEEFLAVIIMELLIIVMIPLALRLFKAKDVERKVFPGYVLIKMVLTDETWHLIRNIRGVTGFVGEANKAIPLTEEEVRQMSLEKHEIVVKYNVGETVKITDGPLASFTGIVEEIDPDKNKVRVVVSMFGRETPVELELDQVEVLS